MSSTAGGDPAAATPHSGLLEDSAEDLYENAPCGYLSTRLDGRIVRINRTLLNWLGYRAGDLVGQRSFSDLLSVGGALYYETHLGPLLSMQGEVGGVALELQAAGDTLLLFTDGLTEARVATTDPSGRYGDEAFRLFARGLAPRTATAAVGAIVGLLESFGAGIEDDTAVLALGVPDEPRLSAPVNPGRPRCGPGRTSARPGS